MTRIQKAGDNVEHTRAIVPQEDDIHDAKHDRKIEPAEDPRVDPNRQASETNSNHNELTPSSEGREMNPEHDYHVDKCRGFDNHGVIAHERSDGGSAGSSGQQDEKCNVGTIVCNWCSAKQAYQVERWSTSERCVAPCMNEFNRRQQSRGQRVDYQDNDASDDEGEQLVCNMTGKRWEYFIFPNHHRLRSMCFSDAHGVVSACGGDKHTPV